MSRTRRRTRNSDDDRLDAEDPVIRLARQHPHEAAASEKVAQPVTVLTFALRNSPPTAALNLSTTASFQPTVSSKRSSGV